MKVPFCPEDMLLSFISPTFSLPPRPSGSSPGSGAFICVRLPPWKHQVSGAGQLGRLSSWHSRSPSSSCSCVGTPRLPQVRGKGGEHSAAFWKVGRGCCFSSSALLKMHAQGDRHPLYVLSSLSVLGRPRGTMGLAMYSFPCFQKCKD